ncbi:MAG: phosphatidylglycerophosphatase A [Firmicutes bacterium]|uniref:Phosphatidylglycerophosphatase A n=1 Tax=Melghirimyces thermohalophilus TaxID=1236220 RepID=A0A1G6MKG0_9BACL|nr:phosphatidylglycerophosphatase A [Bacillota bacterium]SDC55951.1 Phosphatidylglycerophosphatase A [Melghirimyces thermohalophilus]
MFYRHTIDLLKKRGVTLTDIATIVFDLQHPYNDQLDLQTCLESVEHVMQKREVQHALITGVALDELAERHRLPTPLQEMMEVDEPLYGIDEILALSITNVYGTIGLTSFGYLDKTKEGVIQKLNNHGGRIHVFLDDLIAGVAAAASARIAHENPDMGRYLADAKGSGKGPVE